MWQGLVGQNVLRFQGSTGVINVNPPSNKHLIARRYSLIKSEVHAGQVDPEWNGGVTEGMFGEP